MMYSLLSVGVLLAGISLCQCLGLSEDSGFPSSRSTQNREMILQRNGYPIELNGTVLDCLIHLGQTVSTFAGVIINTPLMGILQGEDPFFTGPFTVFAPTNEALDGRLFSDADALNHMVEELVPNSLLRSGVVLRSLGRIEINFPPPLLLILLLHVTNVHYLKETFINGAQVNASDACLAQNGIVHILNDPIPFSFFSILDRLSIRRFSRFSRFLDLLVATNVSQFLGLGVNTSRTVFAPTNEAFDMLPAGALECLLRPENARVALKIVLTHITFPVEYTSSLSLRNSIRTFSGFRLLVRVIDGTIHLIQGKTSVPLLDMDPNNINIPAINGVAHALPQVLLANKIDFEKLCPTPPTPPPTDLPPT